ncbi:MAG: DUF1572 domain-containing protein [Crocinitomicaceae bacterium]|jgi:hypothetical protein|nr:DUF1572 domain-containing protein [Crocinitomicaceae bacterium]
MNSSEQLANRFREVILNGTWIANTNWQMQLTDVTIQQAITKIDSFNTIAALTFHIDYYIAGMLQVFDGGTLDIKDKYSFDISPLSSESDWQNLKQKLFSDSEKFASHVEKMSPEKLATHFVDEKYGSYARNIDAMIEHAYYHLGQIAFLKKMVLEK